MQATITLPKSDIVFVKHYPNQKMESFIDSLVSFFEFIKGVPKTIVFDNMRNVVSKFTYRNSKEYNSELIKLSNYYKFEIITTNPRKGNEKGHVENAGKIARTNLFTFNYEFNSLEEMRKHTEMEMAKLNMSKISELKIEQNYLTRLPLVRYELGRPQKSLVDSRSLISIDNNYYSVPDRYVGKTVYSNIYLDHINVYDDKYTKIASHNKKAGKEEYSLEILHFTTTFRRKPGALANSLALKQAPKVYQTLFHKHFNTKPKEFIDLITKFNIYELSEILVELKSGKYKLNISPKNINPSIEDISVNQLDQISNLYNQGERPQ